MPKPIIDLDNLETETISDPALQPEPTLDNSTSYSLFLDPETLIDAENVRPGETKADHAARVKLLMGQLLEDGQRQPVTVIRWAESYQVVDGQGRVDALRIINRARKSLGTADDGLFAVWCVLDTTDDSWGSAVKLNVQRRNYTDLQLAALIADARTRYKWDRKGGEKKLAEFFGITPQLLVEYNSLADLPADVREQLEAGELSRSAALKLIQLAPADEKREAVGKKAKVLAQAEIDKKYETSRKNLEKAKEANSKVAPKETALNPKGEAKPVKVQAQHIAEAARQHAQETGEQQAPVKRNRTEILAAIAQLAEFTPDTDWGKLGKSFANGVQRFADGDFSPKQLQNRWNTLLGINKSDKPAPKK